MSLYECLEKLNINRAVIRFTYQDDAERKKERITLLKELFILWKDDRLTLENGTILYGVMFFDKNGAAYVITDDYEYTLEELMFAVDRRIKDEA